MASCPGLDGGGVVSQCESPALPVFKGTGNRHGPDLRSCGFAGGCLGLWTTCFSLSYKKGTLMASY